MNDKISNVGTVVRTLLNKNLPPIIVTDSFYSMIPSKNVDCMFSALLYEIFLQDR